MLMLVILGLLLAACPFQAGAQLCFFWDADMRASEMVPPTGSEAMAHCIFWFSSCWLCDEYPDDSFEVELWRLNDFTGVPESWQIRSGAVGENGAVLYERAIPDQSLPIGWQITFDPDLCPALNDTLLHMVITSDLFPDGEARGQLIPDPPVPTMKTTWGRIRGEYR